MAAPTSPRRTDRRPDDHELRPGRRATVTLVVGEGDTAAELGCGDVDVLGTPRVLALAEQAAVLALDQTLPQGKTSVGAWVELDHLVPSRAGETVAAEAVLLGVHGRRLEFSISVTNDGGDEVAHLRHRRIVVSRDRFTRPSVVPPVDMPTVE